MNGSHGLTFAERFIPAVQLAWFPELQGNYCSETMFNVLYVYVLWVGHILCFNICYLVQHATVKVLACAAAV